MQRNISTYIEEILKREVGEDVAFSVERQEVAGRGDYSSNIALMRAKSEKRSPMELAEDYAARIKEKYPPIFHAIEPAAPGFLNFYIDHHYLLELLRDSLKPDARQKNLGKASVEFISANPTGPMHVGNARGGPIGDVIANLLTGAGYKVTREYFHNDAGAQVERFAASLWHWYLVACGKPSTLPEDGYQGEYLEKLGRGIRKKHGLKLLKDPDVNRARMTHEALGAMLKANIALAGKMGISFDKIVIESELVKSKTRRALDYLKKKGLLKKEGGALWFKSGDVEAVVVKSDDTYVYFANDIAYHRDKFKRANIVVDEFGEGHEGHIPKLRAVADAFGFPQDNLKIVVHGQVALKRGGEIVSMAKRKGNFITAEEVLGLVGRDAFRYFFLQYAPRSAMVFDLDLARARSKENPVYYIQYAHARASGILRRSDLRIRTAPVKAAWELLDSEPELVLIKQILALQEVVDGTVRDFQLQRLTRYAYELARAFTHFYETTPVLNLNGSQTSVRKSDFRKGMSDLGYTRLALVSLLRETIRRALALMGISAPDKM